MTATYPGDRATLDRKLEELRQRPLDAGDKATWRESANVEQLARENLSLLSDSVPLPQLVIKESALEHNVKLLQAYADSNGAWLAPHAKTTMAPQVLARQLETGAWALCVATLSQFRVCRSLGVKRIFIVNEVTAPFDLGYLAEEVAANRDLEVYVLVDSRRGLELLIGALNEAGGPTSAVRLLIEYGCRGGRCGVRGFDEFKDLLEAVLDAEPTVVLAGIEGYEGVVPRPDTSTWEVPIGRVDAYLEELRDAAKYMRERLGPERDLLISAGGSPHFDRAVRILNANELPTFQLVIRPGGYITHDSGYFEKVSPFGAQSNRDPFGTLIPAFEAWCAILSIPEPNMAILGIGRRDLPTEGGSPIPEYVVRDGQLEALSEFIEVTRVNDHHLYLQLPDQHGLEVGDVLVLGIQHPSAAFDSWRTLLIVDDTRQVVDAIRTFF